jgi:hypothetical protein
MATKKETLTDKEISKLEKSLKFNVGEKATWYNCSNDRYYPVKILKKYVSKYGEKLYDVKKGRMIGDGIFECELVKI